MPTDAEAELIAEVRREVADALKLTVTCTTGAEVKARYAELMAQNAAKASADAAKTDRRTARAAAKAATVTEDDDGGDEVE